MLSIGIGIHVLGVFRYRPSHMAKTTSQSIVWTFSDKAKVWVGLACFRIAVDNGFGMVWHALRGFWLSSPKTLACNIGLGVLASGNKIFYSKLFEIYMNSLQNNLLLCRKWQRKEKTQGYNLGGGVLANEPRHMQYILQLFDMYVYLKLFILYIGILNLYIHLDKYMEIYQLILRVITKGRGWPAVGPVRQRPDIRTLI